MRLLRLALITTASPCMPTEKELSAKYGDVDVAARHATLDGASDKNAILLVASSEIPRPPINSRREVTVDPTVRVSLERATSVFADLAAVATRSDRTVSSPYPWIALTDLSHEDRDYLDGAVGFELSQAGVRNRMVLPLSLDDPGLLQLATDRLDGVSLMAEGLSSPHETGQFHEYVRVFERAFALGPFDLISPLTEFLAGVPQLGYDRDEVDHWLRVLRHLTTHADRRADFAIASDVGGVVWRVEQAAYDVLFNKRVWRSSDSERRTVYTWRSGIGRNEVFMAQGSTSTFGAQLADGFGTFPLYIGGLSAIPKEWWIGVQSVAPPAIDRAAGEANSGQAGNP